jgi:hypothetical protein
MDEHAPGRATHITGGGGNVSDSPTSNDPAAPQRLSGRVRGLERTIQIISRGGRHGGAIQFVVYRFRLDRLQLAFYEPLSPGDVDPPLLSEGDRVELVIQRYIGRRPDQEEIGDDGVVMALRKLDNDRRYVSHSIFRWLHLERAPIGYTLRMLREALYWTLGLSVASCVAITAFGAAVSSSTPWMSLLGDCVRLAALINTAIWVPVAVLQLRWRLGRPTRRQAYTEQVYAAIGFGSPLRPVAGLIEL